MIFIIAHIIFAFIGLAALSRGEVALSKSSQITGSPARLIGVFALLTYPIAWVIGFCFGMYWAANHGGESYPLWTPLLVNFGAFVIVGLAICMVVRNTHKGKSTKG